MTRELAGSFVFQLMRADVLPGADATAEMTGGVLSGAVVANDNGADDVTGEVALLPAASAEVTR
jgi:hypothetical protein